MKKLLASIAAAAALVLGLVTLPASPAAAASLQEVTGFGTNPTNLRMHLYVPDQRPANPAVNRAGVEGPELIVPPPAEAEPEAQQTLL